MRALLDQTTKDHPDYHAHGMERGTVKHSEILTPNSTYGWVFFFFLFLYH